MKVFPRLATTSGIEISGPYSKLMRRLDGLWCCAMILDHGQNYCT